MLKKQFYNILFCLATLALTSLQAAHLLQQEGVKNDAQEPYIAPKLIAGYYNYTLHHRNKPIDNSVDPKELAEEQQDFTENQLANKLQNKQGAIFFMVIVSNKQTAALSKFFFFNRAPNIEQGVVWKVQKAHQCHVISHHKPKLGPHIVFQLLSWLELEKSQYTPIFIYASNPICVTCNALVESFFNLHILSSAKGCNGLNSIDLDNTCPLAQQYIKRGLTFPLAKKLLLPTLRLTYENKIKLLEQNLVAKDEQVAKALLENKTLYKDIEAKTQDNTSLKSEVNQLKQNVALANAQATKLLLEKEDIQKELNWFKKEKSNLQKRYNSLVQKNNKLTSILKDRIELPFSPLKGHTCSVYSVAITHDNQYIVSGSWDNTIRIWDFNTGDELPYSPLKGHTDQVLSVAVTSDNKYIVSSSEDNTIRIWDLKTGKELPYSPLTGHYNSVYSVAITHDNQYIVSGSGSYYGTKDNTICIWDFKTGKQLPYSPLASHTSYVNSVAVTSDNQYIVSGSSDTTIRIWDFNTGEELSYSPLKGHKGGVNSVAVTNDNQYIVSGSYDNTIRIWDFKTGKQLAYSPLKGHTSYVYSVAVTHDNQYIVSGSWDNTIRIWDFNTGNELSYSPLKDTQLCL